MAEESLPLGCHLECLAITEVLCVIILRLINFQFRVRVMDTNAMSPHDFLDLICNRDTAANTLWTVYIAVAAGIATLLASDRPILRKPAARLFGLGLFAVFAFINGSAIWNTLHQRTILLSMLPTNLRLDELKNAFSTITAPQLIWFHGVFDLAVMLAIWFIPARQSFEHRERPTRVQAANSE